MAGVGLLAGAGLAGKKSNKQRRKDRKAREGGHYSKKGRPGPSEKYTGIKPGGAASATPAAPGPTRGVRPSRSLGGARTPLSP